MIDTSSTSWLTAPTSSRSESAAKSSSGPNVLGKDAFLKLLVTQLRYQDPLNPLDQEQFMAQTAQFSSLEQLQAINKGLQDLNADRSGPDLGQAASLLGKTVQVGQSAFGFGGAAAPALGFDVDGHASDVQVAILDAQGNAIRTLSTGALDDGAHTISWDGRDSAGQLMTPGTYTYRVSATAAAGAPSTTAWVSEGTVTGLKAQGGQVLYQIGTALVREDDIVSVS